MIPIFKDEYSCQMEIAPLSLGVIQKAISKRLAAAGYIKKQDNSELTWRDVERPFCMS